MQLTKNFNLKEFACNDGTPVPEALIPNAKKVAEQLQVLRDYLDTALYLNSAYRTPKYNKKVGGASKSQHLLAKAADIRSDKYTPAQIREAILHLISTGEMQDGGVGFYNGFIHYDIATPRRWDLRK